MAADFELHIAGKKIPMNEFFSDLVHDVIEAVLKNLSGFELDTICRVEIS